MKSQKEKKSILLTLDKELYDELKKEADEKDLNFTSYLKVIISQRV